MKIRYGHCCSDLAKTVRSAFVRNDAGTRECPGGHTFQPFNLTPVDFLINQLQMEFKSVW